MNHNQITLLFCYHAANNETSNLRLSSIMLYEANEDQKIVF